ncbi:hypothetical protein ZWY2020_016149 [Hordeum vulgare]|nr:hypothetical protein ZWY2020_016149 [Hordeum vulgare]
MDDKEEDVGPKPTDNNGQGGELHGDTGEDTRALHAGEVLEDTATAGRKPPGGDGLVHPRGALPAEEATPTTEAPKEGDGGGPRGTGADAFPKEDATPTPPTITTTGVIPHGPNGRDGREHLRGPPLGALPAEDATPTTDAGMDVSEEPRILVRASKLGALPRKQPSGMARAPTTTISANIAQGRTR